MTNVEVYKSYIHSQICAHLEAKANTALLRFKDATMVRLIVLEENISEGLCSGEAFGAVCIKFDPDLLLNVTLVTDDPLMAPEWEDADIIDWACANSIDLSERHSEGPLRAH